MKFQGKSVVVTAGAQGIGMATCLAFAKEGASVIIADIDEEAGRELETSICEQGGNALFIRTDVGVEGDIKNLVQKAVEQLDRIDILINNAGIGTGGSIFDRSKEAWDRVIAVNLTAPYLCTKYAAPYMKDIGGVIISISSTRALMSEPDTEPYSASKGGVLALTHSLALSLGEYGIRVNAISPGWIETSMHRKESARKEPVHSKEDHRQHPAGRVGRPQDIASACLFLAGEDAGFITGTNLVIDGGMTVKMIYV